MRFLSAALALPVLALASPVAIAQPAALEKRSYSCALTASNVRYHTTPYVSSPAPGQYGRTGTHVNLVCWRDAGEYGPSDTVWYKATNGYWSGALFFAESCFDHVPHC